MKAKSVGLMAEDYTTDHVKDISALYKGHRILEGVSEENIQKMYNPQLEVDASELDNWGKLSPNEFLIMRNGKQSALGTFDASCNRIRKVDKTTAYGITPRNAEQIFALDALMNEQIKLVTISGKAGTGKLFLHSLLHWKALELSSDLHGSSNCTLSNQTSDFCPEIFRLNLIPHAAALR